MAKGGTGITLPARSVRDAVCEAMGSAVPEGFRPQGSTLPPVAAGTGEPESVAVDRVAADPAVFDTDTATSYRDGVKQRFEVTPTTEPDSLRRQRGTAPTFTVTAREEGQEHGDRCARTKRDETRPPSKVAEATMSRAPWKLDGPARGPDPAGVSDALRRLHEGRPGPARDEDRPPPSLFPMTPAARAALRMARGK